MTELFKWRKRLTSSEVNKLFVDHLESLIASGVEFDESQVRRYWAAAEVAASKVDTPDESE